MAHPFSWPSYISHEHLLDDPRYDRDHDRHLHGHVSPVPWSPSQRHFYAPPFRRPSHFHNITSTQPFEPTISPLPSPYQSLAVGHKAPKPPTAKPMMTFKAVLESLENSNVKAHGFFVKFHHSFNEDISPNLRVYATRPCLDIIWSSKIQHHETKSRTPRPATTHHQNPTDDAANYNTEQSFLELRDELLRRCTSMANLKVPHWPLAVLDDLQRRNTTHAFVAKLTSSIRTLTPNLLRCDRSVSALKAALSEMATISNILTCHDDGRDREGIRREENDVLEGEGGGGRGNLRSDDGEMGWDGVDEMDGLARMYEYMIDCVDE